MQPYYLIQFKNKTWGAKAVQQVVYDLHYKWVCMCVGVCVGVGSKIEMKFMYIAFVKVVVIQIT